MHTSCQHVKWSYLQLRLILYHAFLANDRTKVIDICGSQLTQSNQATTAHTHESSRVSRLTDNAACRTFECSARCLHCCSSGAPLQICHCGARRDEWAHATRWWPLPPSR